jgi:hypothetical protein
MTVIEYDVMLSAFQFSSYIWRILLFSLLLEVYEYYAFVHAFIAL